MKGIVCTLVYDPEEHKYEASNERMQVLVEDLADWCARRRLFGGFRLVANCNECGRIMDLSDMPCSFCERQKEREEKFREEDLAAAQQEKACP